VSAPLCFVLFQSLRFGYSTLEKRHATASKLPRAMWKASTSNRWPDIGVFVTHGVMVSLRLAVRPHIAEVNVEFLAENKAVGLGNSYLTVGFLIGILGVNAVHCCSFTINCFIPRIMAPLRAVSQILLLQLQHLLQ
jgi:hypothetical protein